MAVTAYTAPTAASGTNWTNPTNVYASDNSRAAYANAGQNDLFVTGFGFAIPAGATILGIEVTVEGNGANATAANRSIAVGMTKNGTTLAGSRLASQNLPQTTDGTLTYGSDTNLFSTTLTRAEVNTSTFGVMLRTNNTNTAQRNIDQVLVRVHYAPLVDILTDDFNDNSLDTAKWTEWAGGDYNESSQQLNITSTTAASYHGGETPNHYSLVGTQMLVEVPHVLTGLTDAGTFFQAVKDANNTLTLYVYSGTIIAEKAVAGVFTTLTSTTYNATTMRWWQIRESAGTVYWEYSATGAAGTWTTFTSSTAFTPDDIVVSLFIGTDSANGGTDTAVFDNFNLPPTASTQAITLPFISAVDALYAMTLSLVLGLPFIGSVDALYAPSVAVGPLGVTLPHISDTNVLYAPTVTPGDVDIVLPHIASTSQLYAPSFVAGYELTLPFISSVAQLFAPVVSPQPVTVVLPFIASAQQLFPPLITAGALGIMLPHIPSAAVINAPVVRRAIDPNELLLLGVG